MAAGRRENPSDGTNLRRASVAASSRGNLEAADEVQGATRHQSLPNEPAVLAEHRLNVDGGSPASSPKNAVSSSAAKLLTKMRFDSPERKRGYTEQLRPLGSFFRHLCQPALDSDGDGYLSSPPGHLSKQRVAQEPLAMWLPDTIVWESGRRPTWYYTDAHGFLRRSESFSSSDVIRRFQPAQKLAGVVGILKYAAGDTRSTASLVDSKGLPSLVPSLGKSGGGDVVLQRFVRCGLRARLLRCRWQRLSNAVEVLLISNKTQTPEAADEEVSGIDALLVESKNVENLDMMQVNGAWHTELSTTMQRMIDYLVRVRGLDFGDFVMDFLKDETGRLWLCQVKAFSVHSFSSSPLSKEARHKNRERLESLEVARCGLCECSFQPRQLDNILTGHQIHQVRQRLQLWHKALSWAGGSAGDACTLAGRDTTTYNTFAVCQTCYDLQQEMEKLATTSARVGRLLGDHDKATPLLQFQDPAVSDQRGIDVWAETAYAANALAPTHGKQEANDKEDYQRGYQADVQGRGRRSSLFAKNTRSRQELQEAVESTGKEMPNGWRFAMTQCSTQAVLEVKRPRWLFRFRFILLAQGLAGGSDWLREAQDEHGLLALTFSIFCVKRCAVLPPLDGSGASGAPLRLNAIYAQHLFAVSEVAFLQWVHSHPPISMYVVAVQSGTRLAYGELDLRSALKGQGEPRLSEVTMRGRTQGMYLPQLRVALGLSGGEAFDCEGRDDLRPYLPDALYLPPPGDASPEPLPQAWLAYICDGHSISSFEQSRAG